VFFFILVKNKLVFRSRMIDIAAFLIKFNLIKVAISIILESGFSFINTLGKA
jgi:hypothetical protein